ncbi:MAG TPA: sigma-70 family RNA polymerase sigma factor [Fimbriimonas sp.]|nr:sigma-70 family RNA polymerase sigma factor [Fimbriimonas sp.]
MIETSAQAPESHAAHICLEFAEARTEYQSLIFAFISRRIKPVEDAEDLTAQVFVDAYRGWRKLRGSPKLWLLGIARRKVYDAWRKRRPSFSLREEDASSDGMEIFVGNLQMREAMRIALALPALERDALLLQVLDDLSVEEIALVLGRSTKATNSLLQRARARVRKMTGNQNGESIK